MSAVEIPETRLARTKDGVLIAYQVFGEGPDLVYVHRFVATIGYMWDVPPLARFLREMSQFCRVYAIDPRGTGMSDRSLGDSTLALEARVLDLLAVMDAESLSHATFLGCEDGGSLCALLAATHPARVDRLILHATQACGVQRDDYPSEWSLESWNEYFHVIRERGDTPDWMEKEARLIAPSVTSERENRLRVVNMYRLGAEQTKMLANFEVQRDLDIRSILPSIQAPTLVIHPSEVTGDVGLGREESRYVAARIPDARLLDVANADLEIYSGNPATILGEIEEFLTGSRRVLDANRVLVTVLFTDIVDSTARAVEMGDARWKELLAEHDERAKAEIDRAGGRFVNTTGDGLLATFDGPARAVRCAQAIGNSVRPLGLEIRSGCHAGEIELVDHDVRGLAVHIGARVAALAEPGEVLVSSTVKDLTAGSGLVFEDRGDHDLKGVPDRWHLFRAVNDTG
jgi:class 3 adenylate cyclase